MAGKLHEPSVQAECSRFKYEIPDEFRPTIRIMAKTRLRIYQDSVPSIAIVAVTSQGHLLIFSKGQLVKNCITSFKDTHRIVIYRYSKPPVNKEFAILFSLCGNAEVIDLESLSVVKSWNDVSEVHVKDQFSLGYSQIVIQVKDELSPIVATYESNWEKVLLNTEHFHDTDNQVLQSVSHALETQIRNFFLNLLQIQRKISLRKSIINRSLTILKEQLMNQTATKKTPSFLMKVVGNNSDESNCQSNGDLLKTSLLWHGVVNNYWIIGTSVTNTSDKELKDVQCMLTTENASLKYKAHYYPYNYGNTPSSTKNITLSTNADNLLRPITSTMARRTKNYDNLTIIIVVSIPEFADADYEKGNLLLACSFSDNSLPTDTIQINLGFVELKFEELQDRTISIDPQCSDASQLRWNILAMMSALAAEEIVDLSSSLTTTSDSFGRVCQQLNIIKIIPMQCYYGYGFYGHVIITIQKETTNTLQIKIRAESTLHVKWVIRSLKSVMGDMTKLCPVETLSILEPFPFQRNINSVLNLLSKTERDDELTVIEENATENVAVPDSSIDLIRKEFSTRRLKLHTIDQQGHFNIPYADYHQWQKMCFT